MPTSEMSASRAAARAGAGPESIVGSTESVRWMASLGSVRWFSPIIRLTQPRRATEPVSASSISSIAEKCERFGTGSPTACTAASWPEVNSHSSGFICGCRPHIASWATRDAFGTAMVGRAV